MVDHNQQKLGAILYVMAKNRFHILEVEALAKALDAHDRLTFELVGPKGRFKCKFLDAHYGMFEREEGGAMNVSTFQFVSDVHCENIGGFE
jgi:hypothetical protein